MSAAVEENKNRTQKKRTVQTACGRVYTVVKDSNTAAELPGLKK